MRRCLRMFWMTLFKTLSGWQFATMSLIQSSMQMRAAWHRLLRLRCARRRAQAAANAKLFAKADRYKSLSQQRLQLLLRKFLLTSTCLTSWTICSRSKACPTLTGLRIGKWYNKPRQQLFFHSCASTHQSTAANAQEHEHAHSVAASEPPSVGGECCPERPKSVIWSRQLREAEQDRPKRKTDPVARGRRYRSGWQAQRAPGESNHQALRWKVREQLIRDQAPPFERPRRQLKPNNYVVPTEKKRQNLRWAVREHLVHMR
eukprot:m.127346 g.127346  ORF g.127346 m.127346 type:complete len:260 (+) comp9720_c2_seq2:174-953(+)